MKTTCIGHRANCGCMTCDDARYARRQMLEQAADIVEEVVASLDRTEVPCKCCGLKSRSNWAEHQAAQELDAIIRKLQVNALRLGRGGAR